MACPASPFAATGGGVVVAVHLKPRSSANAICGVEADANGKAWLKVRVSAPPEKGRANAQLMRLLAKEWGLGPSRLALTAGASARRKTVLVKGDGEALLKALEKCL